MKKPKSLSLSPSSATTWSVCTAQPGFVYDNWELIPPQDTSYSVEGTTAHAYNESVLLNEEPPLGVTEEMTRHGARYVEYARSLSGDDEYVEMKLPLYYQAERNGIVDYVKVAIDGSEIHILDYKYGFKPVYAVRNKQLAIYGKNVITHLGDLYPFSADTKVTLHIDQPRVYDEPSTWMLTLEELDAFLAENIDPAVDTIIYFNESATKPEFAPSDEVCHFCPAASFCIARAQWLAKDFEPIDAVLRDPASVIEDPTEVVGFAPPETMDDIHLQAALSIADSAIKWFGNVRDYVKARLLDDKPVEGFKLVEGKGSRNWGDEQAAEKFLRRHLKVDGAFTKKLLSPAAAEKALKGKLTARSQKILDSLIVRRDGKATLVPESDSRPSLTTPEEQFEDLDGTQSETLN